MDFKEKIYQHYRTSLQQKIDGVQATLDELAESLKNETKSTAGDKHETARAFVHIEQANIGRQLSELQEQQQLLNNLDRNVNTGRIVNGSLVLTNKGYLLVGVALGKATVDNQKIFALSAASPLGQKLMGLTLNEVATINEITYTIEAIS